MKAWVLHDIAQIRCEETEKPKITENEVLVAVRAVGICGSDIPRIYKTGAYSFPLIPGHEFSGIVVESGSRKNKGWVGKRVGVFPLIPCRSCMPCRKKQYEMCKSYSYLGSRRDGGFAQHVAVPVDNLVELPEAVTFEAAAMLEPMSVAVHAMKKVTLHKEKTFVICGLGTIGMLLLMFLKDAGISNILVVGNKEFQKQKITELGLNEECYCNSKETDVNKWILEHTGGNGADVFFECVGTNETLTLAVNGVAPSGELVLVGNPASDMLLEKAVYWKILRNQLTIKGTWNSSFLLEEEDELRFNRDDWFYVLKRLSQRRINPEQLITHRFPLEDLEKGFLIMRDKTEPYCKVMGIDG